MGDKGHGGVDGRWDARVIAHNFRRNGLMHLTIVHDSLFGNVCQVTHPYLTFCGKNIPIGTGGWGYGNPCPECHKLGAVAEHI